ncbi:PhzF family phenazine biosynthesis protein [Exiguobacterium profundum]|uniref:PhzF family phenazine biosynthesis protein n=1 Tax=Exiguobacterium TaxID=33986 RepID=UPI00168C9ADF|nr:MULTISPECIES: PhzF family phenazine biosynthesis protein [Exiguobacterium]QLQ21360.1 MAG: PhzF family phenazine biosynthesis protein [Paracoccaceae bacterium]QPI68404.1 PhzF family phenazine biosynthesis protein [Exiguobacterium sp. PBE]MCT4798448.1 PhzF family phenazine biosynthesis protein [Exiguobacterium profundum]MCV9900055.1 PhzF family phenazine biosynthesis protein [Exiguobacterium sp. N5]MDT0192298.1 PhzF family phenazine biosynthesis protein [Exiguobacterium sp. BG5(2022)]
MLSIDVYVVHAFSKDGEGGNAAGVVLHADALTELEMKQIAKKVGYSETAFVSQSHHADVRVRFFTPEEEVDLCGHATIATFHVLKEQGLLGSGRFTQETRAGVLEVEIRNDLTIMMQQRLPEFLPVTNHQEIADSLKVPLEVLDDRFPILIGFTGLRDILIPIKSLTELLSIQPDFEKVKEISRQSDVVGYHLFTLETMEDGIAHTRNFAPLYGIDEESATGTSNGALACYLFEQSLVLKKSSTLVMEQGYGMKLPSEILVELTVAGEEISHVTVGGKATTLSVQHLDF